MKRMLVLIVAFLVGFFLIRSCRAPEFKPRETNPLLHNPSLLPARERNFNPQYQKTPSSIKKLKTRVETLGNQTQ